MIDCLQCGHGNREGRGFCGNCGRALSISCNVCDFLNDSQDRFCGGCGAILTAPSAASSAAPARVAEPSFEPPTAPVNPTRSQAENRQLTVMLCDVVNWTQLSQQLDGEDLREIIRACQDAWKIAISEMDGYVARYMGDGALVYFGYPVAHEADPERAIRAALGITEAMVGVAAAFDKHAGVEVKVRVGIATGPVVVGDLIGEEASLEKAVVGETPNLAARLESLAPPNGVVVSETTHRIVGGLFDYEDLGLRKLKGFDEPVRAWRVLGERSVDDRWEATHPDREVATLVGREEELEVLRRRWELARAGQGQVALLVGPPGIGKSRLTQALRTSLDADSFTLMRYYCTPYRQSSAFYPITSQIERAAGISRDDALDIKLDKLETLVKSTEPDYLAVVPLFANLLSIASEERYGPLKMSPQQQKERTFEAFERQLRGLAKSKPVLVIYEDLHWSDPSTQETIDRMIRGLAKTPAMVVLTFRPEFKAPWVDEAHVATITLNRLSEAYGEHIVRGLLGGRTLPPEVLEQIVRKADGIPLFVEEVTKTVLESEFLKIEGNRYIVDGPLPPMAVPSTLHDSLMARLDRLAPVRDVAQLGAVLGRQFSHSLIGAISRLDETALQLALDKLVEAELVYVQGTGPRAVYTFKHALVRDAAYGSMLRSRRRYLHGRVADALEAEFNERGEGSPEVIAYHLGQAGEAARAVHYLHESGKTAIRRSANREAAEHLSTGLVYLRELGDDAHTAQLEMEFQLALASSLTASRNYAAPEVEQAYLRAEELAERLDDRQRLFVVLRGLWNCYYVQARFDKAEQQNEKMLVLAERANEASYRLIAHQALGQTLIHIGKFGRALDAFEKGIKIADGIANLRYGRDSGVFCYAYGALALWCLGDTQGAVQWSDEAIERGKAMQRPFIYAQTLGFASLLYTLMRDVDKARARSAETIAVSEEFVFPYWLALAKIVQGWAQSEETAPAQGLAMMLAGLSSHEQTGAMAVHTWFLALLAERQAQGGEIEQALGSLNRALEEVEGTGEKMWAAEIWRLRGEFEAQLSDAPNALQTADASLAQALNIAQAQGAKAWSLRISNSLARLRSAQGQSDEATALLSAAVAQFPENQGTPDLLEARALLEDAGQTSAIPPPSAV